MIATKGLAIIVGVRTNWRGAQESLETSSSDFVRCFVMDMLLIVFEQLELLLAEGGRLEGDVELMSWIDVLFDKVGFAFVYAGMEVERIICLLLLSRYVRAM